MPKSKTDFTNFVDARPNYFPGQFLLEDDFEVEQKYLIDRQKYHRQSLHVSGIVEGLEVEVIRDKQEVQIKSGSGINSNGDLIILKKDTSFSKFAPLTNGELYISYKEEKQVKQQEDFTRWQEVPTIGFAATTPNDGVKLAKISIVNNVLTLDLTVRDYSGIFLPNATGNDLTLRSGGNANPNVAILNGSLTVTGTITGKIDATNINSGVLAVDRIPDLSANKITSGTISGSLTISSTGNVGIRTTTPSEKLEVAGNLKVTGTITGKIDATNINAGVLDAARIANNSLSSDKIISLSADKITSGTISRSLTISSTGNVGIGTETPSAKLEVNGNLKVTGTITGKIDATSINSGILDAARIPNLPADKITAGTTKGDLTIDGKLTVLGNQKIKFTDQDDTNNLKLELWTGYGLGINSDTLFYAANGKHSWRDINSNNERMMLTTGANGSLTVNGTGTSSFAGNLKVNGAITPSAGGSKNNGIMFPENPFGGTGDAAWIRYYSRNPNATDVGIKEHTTLEIGISNDPQDYITLNSCSNPINFTGKWQATPDAVTNVAEISNDTSGHKTLMIMGNRSNGQGRRVSVWDRFEVNGTFVNNSSQEHKQDITKLSNEDLNSILKRLKQTPVFRYRFKTPGIDGKIRLGVIAEQSPEDILDESGKAVSFLDYNGFLLAALKAQQSLIENLQNDILLLQKR